MDGVSGVSDRGSQLANGRWFMALYSSNQPTCQQNTHFDGRDDCGENAPLTVDLLSDAIDTINYQVSKLQVLQCSRSDAREMRFVFLQNLR